MEIILKHLDGDQQYRFLQWLIGGAVPDPVKRPEVIQAIMEEVNEANKWIIWSNEHRGWWAPYRSGYVQQRSEAGRYSYREALEIVRKADFAPEAENIPNETMMLDIPKP